MRALGSAIGVAVAMCVAGAYAEIPQAGPGALTRAPLQGNGCFRLDPDDDASRLAAADGYWLMLKPLPRGRHTLSVGANDGAPGGEAFSTMEQNVEYVLHVGDRSQVVQLDPVPGVGAAP